MDTKFSSAIHTLILISDADREMNSEQLAASVGTNPSYIRKLTAKLSKAGIIESRRGISGMHLAKAAKDITLFEIYSAVTDTPSLHLFDLHRNPNDACIVGHNIRPVLGGMFRDMEAGVERELRNMTLADCIGNMRNYIENRHETDGGRKENESSGFDTV